MQNGSGAMILRSIGSASYFEYDQRHGRFVRESGAGVGRSTGMRAEYLPGDPHGGFLHLAFGKTPSAYMKPVDAGTARYREIYWRFDLRLQPGWTGGGADKLTRATDPRQRPICPGRHWPCMERGFARLRS